MTRARRSSCPSCRAPLRSGLSFCENCGLRLDPHPPPGVVCSACLFANRPGVRFCESCGTPLPAPLAPPPSASAGYPEPAHGRPSSRRSGNPGAAVIGLLAVAGIGALLWGSLNGSGRSQGSYDPQPGLAQSTQPTSGTEPSPEPAPAPAPNPTPGPAPEPEPEPAPQPLPQPPPQPEPGLTYEVAVPLILDDLESWWAEQFPEWFDGFPYYELRSGYLSQTGTLMCGDHTTSSWAFYCQPDDYIAWDHSQLSSYYTTYGALPAAMVLAHEWGHAIQHRFATTRQYGIEDEAQADCFAGAWVAHIIADGHPTLTFDSGDIGEAHEFIMARLGDDLPYEHQDAHGSAAERLARFDDGIDYGPGACKTYDEKEDPTMTWGEIVGYRLSYDIVRNGQSGVLITVDVHTNAMNQVADPAVVGFVYHAVGNTPVPNSGDPAYTNVQGFLYTRTVLDVTEDNQRLPDVELFIPYGQFLQGRADYVVQLSLRTGANGEDTWARVTTRSFWVER